MRELPSQPKSPTAHQTARERAQLKRAHMPVMRPLWLFESMRRAVQRWRMRRALRALLARDDHILCDLGYSRALLRRRLNNPRADVRPARGCDVYGGW